MTSDNAIEARPRPRGQVQLEEVAQHICKAQQWLLSASWCTGMLSR